MINTIKTKKIDKKSIVLMEIIMISIFVALVTTTYAFFTASVASSAKQSVITTGTMRLEFADGVEVNAQDMTPGHSISKTFKVKNIGNVDTIYDIYLSEIINTFVDKDDLVYTVESSNGCSSNVENTVPSVSSEESKVVKNCSISPNVEHSYILNIIFKETNDNQNDNAGKTFSAKLAANEYSTVEGLAVASEYIEQASTFYNLNSNASGLGTNLASVLNVENKAVNDQVVITKTGKIELAVERNDLCFRKTSYKDEVEVLEKSACNVDMTKFVSNNGQLHVCGTYLCNEDGKEVRITGASTSGIGGTDGFTNPIRGEVNENSLHTLRNWGANGIRSFGVANISGFANFIGHEDDYINSYKQIIDDAIADDMYFIANWDPARNNGASFTENAVDFFTRIASIYPNDPHIIYEIWNEPENNNTWDQVIEHANTVIPAIRSISPDAVIIVGSPNFDSRYDEVVDHPLAYDNLMYTVHAYMGTLSDSPVQKIVKALNDGVALFATEWGTMGLKNDDPMVINAHATSFLSLLNKYRISNMQFCFSTSTDQHDNRYGIVVRGNWDDSLPDSILKPNGKFLKNSLSGGTGGYEAYLLRGNSNNGDYGDNYRNEEWRDKIVSINFANTKEKPQNLVHTFDLSFAGDNSVLGYVVSTGFDNKYNLIIAADGDIYLPTNCSYLFARLKNLKTIDFSNVKSTYLNIFSAVFNGDESLENLDLSNIDSTRITHMWNTFASCKSLTSIDLSMWHAKISTWGWTFQGCSNLTSVDLSGLDVSGTKEFSGLFYGAGKLKTINLSYMHPASPIKTLAQAFRFDYALETVDIRNFDIDDTTILDTFVSNAKSGIKFIVKSEEIGELLVSKAAIPITYEVAS